jgi:RNA polymerase sigma factor (sigma-70 family)
LAPDGKGPVDKNRSTRGASQRYYQGEDDSSIAAAEIANWLSRVQQRSRAREDLPSLSSWMRQMEQYPQLPADAQGELVAAYQKSVVSKEALAEKRKIGIREERKLREEVRRGEQAIEYLMASNFRLVVLIAREKAEARYGRERAVDMLPDLVGYANIALMEAAKAFRPDAGPSFPTYAAGKIRHEVLGVLNREHPIKVPPSWTRLKRIATVRSAELTAELGRTPTREELVNELRIYCMKWAYKKLSEAEKKMPKAEREKRQMDRLRKQGMLGALENLDDVLVQTQAVAYLDAPSREDGSSLGDLLTGDDPDMTAGLEAEERQKAVNAVLADLPERDRTIILHRFGFIDGEQWSYQKISLLYNVSAERIRQIERTAISKLSLPDVGGHLKGFLGYQFERDEDSED